MTFPSCPSQNTVTDMSSHQDVIRINEYSKLSGKAMLLSNLLQMLAWRKFAVVLDSQFEMLQILSVVKERLNRDNVATITPLILQERNSIEYIASELSSLSTSFSRYLVLHNNVKVIRRTFLAAHYLGMNQGTFKWLMQADISLDVLKGFKLPRGLIAVVPTPLPWRQSDVLFDAARVINSAVTRWTTLHCRNESDTFVTCEPKLHGKTSLSRFLFESFQRQIYTYTIPSLPCHTYMYVCICVYVYVYMIVHMHDVCVVVFLSPISTYAPLYFIVSSTLKRFLRPDNFLYIYIYIFFFPF